MLSFFFSARPFPSSPSWTFACTCTHTLTPNRLLPACTHWQPCCTVPQIPNRKQKQTGRKRASVPSPTSHLSELFEQTVLCEKAAHVSAFQDCGTSGTSTELRASGESSNKKKTLTITLITLTLFTAPSIQIHCFHTSHSHLATSPLTQQNCDRVDPMASCENKKIFPFFFSWGGREFMFPLVWLKS